MSWIESDISDGLKNGDRKTFDLVFKHFYPGLCTFAYDYLKSADIAKEIVQEIFLALWEKHHTINIKTSVKAYLYRSVHNRCLNYIRDNKSSSQSTLQIGQLKQEADLLLLEIPDELFDSTFSEQVERELDDAINNLPEQCKIIFCLSRYENLSYPEIASQLNISVSTVKTQMLRAMDKLRENMSKYL
jgi:RNA polymerase sigma-70 factor, ECF subfamily